MVASARGRWRSARSASQSREGHTDIEVRMGQGCPPANLRIRARSSPRRAEPPESRTTGRNLPYESLGQKPRCGKSAKRGRTASVRSNPSPMPSRSDGMKRAEYGRRSLFRLSCGVDERRLLRHRAFPQGDTPRAGKRPISVSSAFREKRHADCPVIFQPALSSDRPTLGAPTPEPVHQVPP